MRKLAAIMFTDIEGFTTKMRLNETEAIRMLEHHKQIYTHQVKQFRGQTIKYMGDGTLTIFSSAIDAVKCAIALQLAMQKEPPIPLRIGIHQGDVILENKDVLGDAVNLASRIQPCGVEGSILISEKVHDELQNHDEISDVALGSFNLKNILHPVNLYAIKAKGIRVPTATSLKKYTIEVLEPVKQKEKISIRTLKKTKVLQTVLLILIIVLLSLWFITKTNGNESNKILKTIAIKPFKNIDRADTNNFLAEGLTQETISLLTSNTELKIIPLPDDNFNSQSKNILKEIKAGSILEGTIQHDNENLSVFVKLTNVSTGQVYWSYPYHGKYRDLMKVQEQIAIDIAGKLNTNFSKADIQNFAAERTDSSEAYNDYIQGQYALRKRTNESIHDAIALFNTALQIDSNFALAYSGVGDAYTILVDNGYISYDSGVNLARQAVNHAFLLDSSSAEIRASRAIFFSALEGRHIDALNELKFALELKPNYANAHHWYALELAADGQFDSALFHINKASELDPLSERIWANKGLILEFARRYKDAINIFNRLIKDHPDDNQLFYKYKAECHYWLGEKDSVLYCAPRINDGLYDYKFWSAVCNHDKASLEKLIKERIKTLSSDNSTLAVYYVFSGDNKKALDVIQNAYNKKEFGWLIYLNVSPLWDSLHNEPVFENIVTQMGLK